MYYETRYENRQLEKGKIQAKKGRKIKSEKDIKLKK